MISVTFDTNALDKAARPERHPKDIRRDQYDKIHQALRKGGIVGFFSETIITLEGIENKDRLCVLGSTRFKSHSEATAPNKITLSLMVDQIREPLNREMLRRIDAARALGMRALRGPSRMGGFRVRDEDGTFYAPDSSVFELAARMDRANSVATAIEGRKVGRFVALELGLKFSDRAGATGEWWLQGLARAQENLELKKVQKAVSEWADADSIAAHVGYGIDLFCSEDYGKNTGGNPSILNEANRSWLSSAWGVRFVTLSELAAIV